MRPIDLLKIVISVALILAASPAKANTDALTKCEDGSSSACEFAIKTGIATALRLGKAGDHDGYCKNAVNVAGAYYILGAQTDTPADMITGAQLAEIVAKNCSEPYVSQAIGIRGFIHKALAQ